MIREAGNNFSKTLESNYQQIGKRTKSLIFFETLKNVTS